MQIFFTHQKKKFDVDKCSKSVGGRRELKSCIHKSLETLDCKIWILEIFLKQSRNYFCSSSRVSGTQLAQNSSARFTTNGLGIFDSKSRTKSSRLWLENERINTYKLLIHLAGCRPKRRQMSLNHANSSLAIITYRHEQRHHFWSECEAFFVFFVRTILKFLIAFSIYERSKKQIVKQMREDEEMKIQKKKINAKVVVHLANFPR